MGGKKKKESESNTATSHHARSAFRWTAEAFYALHFGSSELEALCSVIRESGAELEPAFVFFSSLAVSLMTLFVQRLESCCKLCHKVQSAPPPPSEATEPQAICNKCYHLLPSDYYYIIITDTIILYILQANWWWQVLHGWKISCKKFGIWKNIDWFICKVRQIISFLQRMKSWES